MNAIEKIIGFLNVPSELIEKCEPVLKAEIVKAANDDDFFKVHQLGYFLTSKTKGV